MLPEGIAPFSNPLTRLPSICCQEAAFRENSNWNRTRTPQLWFARPIRYVPALNSRTAAWKPKEKPSENSAKEGFSQYGVHQNTNQKFLPVLKKFPIYHRSLRFRFGELAWQALTWYMEQLRWPQSDSTLGVTWAELCLDFELATGVTLPRGASICAELFGSRLLGRQATWTMETKPNQYNSLEHSVEKVIKKGKVRFQCIVCSRSGAWSDRQKFLRQTCAGYTESPVQAIRRIRLEQSARKCSSDKPLPPATLDEKYQVFADLVGSLARHKKCFHGEKTLTCRALCPLGLPKCAGLTRRPILLYQEQITSEMMHIAQVLPKKISWFGPWVWFQASAMGFPLFPLQYWPASAHLAAACPGLGGRLYFWTRRVSTNSRPFYNDYQGLLLGCAEARGRQNNNNHKGQ